MNVKTTTFVFSLSLFLSAAVMFSVQPMVGKMLLPIVGGTPAGWVVAMAFFQIMLLVGYLLAHVLSRFSAHIHTLLYIVTLLAGCAFLPINIQQTALHGTPEAWDVFKILFANLALPFIALSCTSSTLQRLYTQTGNTSANDPYFLYAASNLGSFAGLLLYPMAIEPFLDLQQQSHDWRISYIFLILMAGICLLLTPRRHNLNTSEQSTHTEAQPLTALNIWKQRLIWITLAFLPSSLMLGVTTQITTDIFSAPMIWVLPLGLYLLTFVIAFGKRERLKLETISTIHPIAVCLSLFFLLMYSATRVSWQAAFVHLAVFTVTALMCHMRLAASRPKDTDSRLTEFYLMLSIGGALGGVLNAFVLPVILNRLIEYPIGLLLSCLLHPAVWQKQPSLYKKALGVAVALTACYAAFILYSFQSDLKATSFFAPVIEHGVVITDILLGAILLLLALHPRSIAVGGSLLLIVSTLIIANTSTTLTYRNFFGVVSIVNDSITMNGKKYNTKLIYHGTTAHGFQILDPAYETTPTAYYSKEGPIGNVFAIYNPKKILVIGLGVGILGCYGDGSNEFTFIDIDPSVIKVAKENFSFLARCKKQNNPKIILGDGRLELSHLKEKFDLIVLDAFTADAIPVHLLTTEAIKLYAEHLNPRGHIVFHISNRYFGLAPILARNAQELHLNSRYKMDLKSHLKNKIPYAVDSQWLAIAPPTASLEPLELFKWVKVTPPEDLRPWTDNYSNLLSTLTLH